MGVTLGLSCISWVQFIHLTAVRQAINIIITMTKEHLEKSVKALAELTCQRCGYQWIRRTFISVPKYCPHCKSPVWDKPKNEKT